MDVRLFIKPGTGQAMASVMYNTTRATNGDATFPMAHIDTRGSGYVLVASAGELTSETRPFDVSIDWVKWATYGGAGVGTVGAGIGAYMWLF